MQPLTEDQIRESFVNTTKGEAERLPMPVWRGDRPVSFVLRAAERRIRSGISAMCSLCHMPQPGSQVTLFAAPRSGEAGRKGDTVGTYICADLGCSAIIRIAPPAAPMQLPPEEIVQRRIAGLQERLDSFTQTVLAG
jgi:hypothetical protein